MNKGGDGVPPARGDSSFGEIIFAAGLVAFSVFWIWQAGLVKEPPTNMLVGPRTFPRMIGTGMLIVSGLVLWRLLRARLRAGGGDDDLATVPLEEDGLSISDWSAVWAVLGSLAAMFFLLEPLGFVPTVVLFVFGLSTFFSPRSWLRNLIVAVFFSCFFFFVFSWLLGIPLPKGILAPFLTNMVG